MAQLSKSLSPTARKPRPSEARLFEFTAISSSEETAPERRFVAASSLQEAVGYLSRTSPDFAARRVELLGIVEIVDSAPLD